jgi:hypothetical protein
MRRRHNALDAAARRAHGPAMRLFLTLYCRICGRIIIS